MKKIDLYWVEEFRRLCNTYATPTEVCRRFNIFCDEEEKKLNRKWKESK